MSRAAAALGLTLLVVLAVVTAPGSGAALLGLAVLVGLGGAAAGAFKAAGMDRGQAQRAAAGRAAQATAGHGIAAPGWRAGGRLAGAVAWAGLVAAFSRAVQAGIDVGGKQRQDAGHGELAWLRDRAGAAWRTYRGEPADSEPAAASGDDEPAPRAGQAGQPSGPEPPPDSPAAPSESRRLDGKPETNADRKFFDERGSGYTGPLDQDGNRADDPRLPFAPPGPDHADPAGGPSAPAASTLPEDTTTNNQEEHMPTPASPRHRGQRADTPGAGVAEYTPETMSELLDYCAAMAKANHAMSEATADFTATLTGAIGLDEQAVSGVAEIGDQYAEVSTAWQQAAERIRSRYEQVIEAVESGVVLPKDGRFIDGDTAAA
jgi:hypothetical protein